MKTYVLEHCSDQGIIICDAICISDNVQSLTDYAKEYHDRDYDACCDDQFAIKVDNAWVVEKSKVKQSYYEIRQILNLCNKEIK